MKNLEVQLDAAFAKITAQTCSKIIKKVRLVEDAFWNDDVVMEEKNVI